MSSTENLVNAGPRQLGDREVGALGFGCWRLVGDDVAAATTRIEATLDCGMTLIDNADVYGLDWGGQAFGESETLLGKVLAASPGLRDRIVLASKGSIIPGVPYNASTAYLTEAVDASLHRLQSEHIDLYQIHRPDMFTHPAETAAALDGLVQAGKISMVGISNYTHAQRRRAAPLFESAAGVAAVGIFTDQFDHAARRHAGPLYEPQHRLSCLVAARRRALATGDGCRPELIAKLDALAARESTDRATLALAFVLAHPAKPVALIGSQSIDRLQAAAQVSTVTLTRADIYALIEAAEGVPLPRKTYDGSPTS